MKPQEESVTVLDVDTTRAFRLVSQLLTLVRAVVSATPEDEGHWIEWKREIDLADPESLGHVARHILGLANRDPEIARSIAGGYGYLLYGVEPGGVRGVPPTDPADLEPRIQRYLGDEGPGWQALWVQVEGADVLVILVDPPSRGDPIFTLAKGFGRYSAGEIFVRLSGRTEKAGPADIRRLTLRATPLDEERRLRISLHGADGAELHFRPIATPQRSVEAWLAFEERCLLRPMLDDLYPPDNAATALAGAAFTGLATGSALAKFIAQQEQMRRMMRGVIEQPEDRTEEKYRQDIADYLARAKELLPRVALMRYLKAGQADLKLEIRNETDYPFRGVELVLHVPGEGVAAHEWERVELPGSPRPWGPRRPLDFSQVGHFRGIGTVPPLHIPATRSRPIIDNGGSSTIRFPAEDVGPEDRIFLPLVRITVPESLAGQLITATWEARSIEVPGVARGELNLTVDEQAVDLVDFFVTDQAVDQDE